MSIKNKEIIKTATGKFAVKIKGKTMEKGEVLVFIHGGMVCSDIWEKQVDFFSESYTVITYDLRGYGQSQMPESPFYHYNDLKEILDYYSIKEAILVGSSLGGSIAIDFCLHYPEMVKKMVLVTPGLSGYKYPFAMTLNLIKHGINIRKHGIEKATDLFLENKFWSYFIPACKEKRILFKDNMLINAPFYEGKQFLGKLPKPFAIKRLNEINVKAMLIRAELDSSFNQKVSDTIEQNVSNIEVVTIESSGHTPNIEQPDIFNTKIREFLL